MIYTAIFKYNTVIADYSEGGGDFKVTLSGILKANRQSLEFYMITYSNLDCFFLHKDEYTFCCVTQQHVDNEKVLVFLQMLSNKYFSICDKEKDNLTLKTHNLIRELMNTYQENLEEDKVSKVENTINVLKKEKFESVGHLLDNQKLLDNIVKKSEDLKSNSFSMKTNFDKKLKKSSKSRLNFYTMIALVLLILLFVIYYILTSSRTKEINLRRDKVTVDYNRRKYMNR